MVQYWRKMILVALEMKLQYMYRISKASRRRDCASGAPGVISLPILERLSVKLKFNCNYSKRLVSKIICSALYAGHL